MLFFLPQIALMTVLFQVLFHQQQTVEFGVTQETLVKELTTHLVKVVE
jgi:hypothetical protein